MTKDRYCSCGDELRSSTELATGTCDTCRLLQESDLHILLIQAMKELGEIAECLIKGDRPGHWKNKIADLCDSVIAPMLELAETDFKTACELGRVRKAEMIHHDRLIAAPVVFGLQQQGHLPIIKKLLDAGTTWDTIGKEIGWDPATAEQHYRWHQEYEKKGEVA